MQTKDKILVALLTIVTAIALLLPAFGIVAFAGGAITAANLATFLLADFAAVILVCLVVSI